VRCGAIFLKPHIGTVHSSSAQVWLQKVQKMSGSCGSPSVCVCKIWLLNKLKYYKISHKIIICQKLQTQEVNALGPHASSAELWLTGYWLPDKWIGDSKKKYRSHCQEIERGLCNAYYNFVHSILLSCLLL
jgi:hypothetical protein